MRCLDGTKIDGVTNEEGQRWLLAILWTRLLDFFMEGKMTIREFLTMVLDRNRDMIDSARDTGDFAKALKKQGAIEIVEVIFMELNKSRLFDEEI